MRRVGYFRSQRPTADSYDRPPVFISSPIHGTSHVFTYITRPPPPPPPTYGDPWTTGGQLFLSQENPGSPLHRNPAYLVRPSFLHVPGRLPRPIPIIGFARPRPPLLGGVIAEPGIHCGFYWAFLLLSSSGFLFYTRFSLKEDAVPGCSPVSSLVFLLVCAAKGYVTTAA